MNVDDLKARAVAKLRSYCDAELGRISPWSAPVLEAWIEEKASAICEEFVARGGGKGDAASVRITLTEQPRRQGHNTGARR